MKNIPFNQPINSAVSHLRIVASGVALLGAAALAAVAINPNPPKLPWAVPTVTVGINPIGVDIDLASARADRSCLSRRRAGRQAP
jgi:hypothetical protein